ncbi:MAG: CBS domain-containing protein [Deltaproteobacteria bacterium]|nr:CBS domain-containing protein [Deltaproteobacteria bacterium]
MFTAKETMTKNVITVTTKTAITEAIKMLIKNKISGLPVVDDQNKLIGILSEKDALKLLHNPSDSVLTVRDFMTKNVVSFDENDSLIKICQCLIDNPFRRVPITKGDKELVGVISRRNIMEKILEMKHIRLEDSGLQGEDA